MSVKEEMVEDVMKDAYGCASFNVQCGKCKETTIVYVLPGSILKRIEDAVPLERAQAAAIAAASAVRSTDEKWEHAPIGNAARMREALEWCRDFMRDIYDGKEGVKFSADDIERINAALSAPSRNCDLQLIAEGYFGSAADKAWGAFRKKHPDAYFDVPGLMRCIGWLLEAATDKKGGEGGE